MSNLIHYEVHDQYIAIITLNRPDAMNALSSDLLDDLNYHLREIKCNSKIRTVIITGTGEKAFCAGADLKERRHMNKEQTIQAVQYIGQTISNIENLPIPVIAAINGAAFGGGLELALACDIRIAADHVKMGLTETSLAIIPGAGGTQRLTRLIGSGQAKKMIYTASPLSADEAHRLGLVEEISQQDTLADTAIAIAQKISKNGPIAIRQAKTAINQGMDKDIHTGLQIEHLCYLQTIDTADRLEGLEAFKEKRKPKYKGK